jgi:hypothetical protein
VHRIEAIDTDRNSYLWYLCLPMLPQKTKLSIYFICKAFPRCQISILYLLNVFSNLIIQMSCVLEVGWKSWGRSTKSV